MSKQVTVTARCTRCGRCQTVRVSERWYDSDNCSCCGRSAAFWLRAGEVICEGGTFQPADWPIAKEQS